MSAANFEPQAAALDVSQHRVSDDTKHILEAPREFEPGTILTLRMRGHSRSPVAGQEYFAPAVVLEQFAPGGEISVLVWDSSAGTHYNASYPIRDVSSRGTGSEREMYVVQDNIGEVLFSPREFLAQGELIESLIRARQGVQAALVDHRRRLEAVEAFVAEMRAPVAVPVAPAAEAAALPATATKDEPKKQPKADSR